MKVTLSVSTRLSLRANFSALRDLCAKHNASPHVLQLIQQLADHAQKLPEGNLCRREGEMSLMVLIDPVGELVKVKSAWHRRLEETLVQNKAEVLRLATRNASERVRLREQAASVTKQLNAEIQREMKEERKRSFWTRTNFSTASSSSKGTTTNQANRVAFILSRSRQNAQDLPETGEVNKILLLFSVLFVILVVLCWRKIEGQTVVVMLVFYLLFVFSFYIV